MGNCELNRTRDAAQRSSMGIGKYFVLTGVFLLGAALMTTSAAAQSVEPSKGQRESTAPDAARLAEARRAIDEGNATAVKAWAENNPAMFASTFTEDALELRPDGSVVRGRKNILELVKASMQKLGSGVELTVRTTSVWLEGDAAYETGKSVYRYTQQGQPRTFETLFVTIWKRQKNGTWKIVLDMPVRQD